MLAMLLSRLLAGRALPKARLALAALICGLLLSTAAVPAGAAEPIAKVNPHGTYADFKFTSAGPVTFTLEVSATPPVDGAFASPLATLQSPPKVTSWSPRVEGLTPNTTYHYRAARNGVWTSKTETDSFTTLKRKVTVNFWAIQVADDSDSWGAGELRFNFGVNGAWQHNLAYGEVSVASGDTTYPDRTAVLLNAPGTLKLKVQGWDNDCDISEPLCSTGYSYIYPTDGGSTDLADWATANSPVIQLKAGPGESHTGSFAVTTGAPIPTTPAILSCRAPPVPWGRYDRGTRPIRDGECGPMDGPIPHRTTRTTDLRPDVRRQEFHMSAMMPLPRARCLVMQALLILALAALLSACGASAKAQPAQGSGGAGRSGAPIDACALVTKAEAAALLGTPVGEPQPKTLPGLAMSCSYLSGAPRDSRSVFVWASPHPTADGARKAFVNVKRDAPTLGTTAHDQAGLGDDAFWIHDQLWVRKGEVVLQVSADNEANTQKLAGQVLMRLP